MTELPDLEEAAVAALEDLDAELAEAEGCVPFPPKAPRVIIKLECNSRVIRALAYPGSEINLVADHLVDDLHLQRWRLTTPTRLGLAVPTSNPPDVLTHFTVATLTDRGSKKMFNRAYFKIGKLGDDYDMILGTPFFNIFRLSVSISQRAVICEETGMKIFDARHLSNLKEAVASMSVPRIQEPSVALAHDWERKLKGIETAIPPSVTEGEHRERQLFEEFRDLFPEDIPAVSDAAEEEGDFVDGSFPAKMQNEGSRIRHKIILKNPDAVINEKQYNYPQKHLKSWRRLIDQHLSSGRIRRSSS